MKVLFLMEKFYFVLKRDILLVNVTNKKKCVYLIKCSIAFNKSIYCIYYELFKFLEKKIKIWQRMAKEEYNNDFQQHIPNAI